MERRRIFLCCALALVLFAMAYGLFRPRTAINKENFAKLREGMTLKEVESILGGPARSESIEPFTDAQERAEILANLDNGGHLWAGHEEIIVLFFDSEYRAVLLRHMTVERADSPFARFRRWISG